MKPFGIPYILLLTWSPFLSLGFYLRCLFIDLARSSSPFFPPGCLSNLVLHFFGLDSYNTMSLHHLYIHLYKHTRMSSHMGGAEQTFIERIHVKKTNELFHAFMYALLHIQRVPKIYRDTNPSLDPLGSFLSSLSPHLPPSLSCFFFPSPVPQS